jgi:hypothetical protein
MVHSSRIKPTSSSSQVELLPTYPTDLVPEDPVSRVLNEIVDALDLRELYRRVLRNSSEVIIIINAII